VLPTPWGREPGVWATHRPSRLAHAAARASTALEEKPPETLARMEPSAAAVTFREAVPVVFSPVPKFICISGLTIRNSVVYLLRGSGVRMG
jgi:hypothetical protein